MYKCIKYTFRIYILLHIKNLTSYTFLLVFKIAESLQCIPKLFKINIIHYKTTHAFKFKVKLESLKL